VKRLVVWWDDRPVGALTQDSGGALGFCYDLGWLEDAGAPAISASLPKRPKPFTRRECRPFFSGLLPEGGQRSAAAEALGISVANDFAFLDRLGGEIAGALQFLPQGERPRSAGAALPPRLLDDRDLASILERLPRRPLLAGEEGLRLSLAGAQSKLPVVVQEGAIALPAPGQPTTHILKPPIARFDATTENEAFAMGLAAAVHLEAAPVQARLLRLDEARPRAFLLVERYDRARDGGGRVRRLHQEDFCQALGVPVERKYQAEGGPGLGDGFALLRRIASRPAADVLRLLDAVIFNALIGNADAHGKNFSILYLEAGPTLAPLYDLLTTVIYPDLSPRFAMKVGRAARLEELDARAWAEFAAKAGLGFPLVRRRVREVAEAIIQSAPDVAGSWVDAGLDPAALERISALVGGRARMGLKSLARSDRLTPGSVSPSPPRSPR